MDDKSLTIRVPKRWARVGMIVGVTALIVAPLTAVAGHVFSDVPGSHTFHNNITWLADAEVTRGCNPPVNDRFCPDDFVTRGQMAAFMQRFAQYIGAEDGTPALADHATTAGSANTAKTAQTANDAAMLGGQASAAYDTFVVGDSSELESVFPGVTNVASVSFSTSTATSAAITGTASFRHTGSTADVVIWAQHNNTTCGGSAGRIPSASATATVAPTEPWLNSAGFTAAIPLSSGSHSLTLCIGGSPALVTVVGLTAVVSPSSNSVVSAATPAASSGISR